MKLILKHQLESKYQLLSDKSDGNLFNWHADVEVMQETIKKIVKKTVNYKEKKRILKKYVDKDNPDYLKKNNKIFLSKKTMELQDFNVLTQNLWKVLEYNNKYFSHQIGFRIPQMKNGYSPFFSLHLSGRLRGVKRALKFNTYNYFNDPIKNLYRNKYKSQMLTKSKFISKSLITK